MKERGRVTTISQRYEDNVAYTLTTLCVCWMALAFILSKYGCLSSSNEKCSLLKINDFKITESISNPRFGQLILYVFSGSKNWGLPSASWNFPLPYLLNQIINRLKKTDLSGRDKKTCTECQSVSRYCVRLFAYIITFNFTKIKTTY